MTQEQITEGNRLIAEFMGSQWTDEDHTEYNEDGTIKYTPNEDGSKWIIRTWSRPEGFSDAMYRLYGWGGYNMGNFEYHSSWDWLMPVVEKIGHVGDFLMEPLCNVSLYSTIMEVWEEVVSAIRWYNQNKQQP